MRLFSRRKSVKLVADRRSLCYNLYSSTLDKPVCASASILCRPARRFLKGIDADVYAFRKCRLV